MHDGEQLALWGCAFSITNLNGVPFTPEGMRVIFYAGDVEEEVYTFRPEDIPNAEALLRRNGSVVVAFSTNRLHNTHAIATVYGTDANGHAIEASGRVDFLRDEIYDQYMNPEPTPTPTPEPTATPEPTPLPRAEIVIEAQQKEVSLVFEQENGREKPRWRAVFRITNKSDVPFSVEGMRMTYYAGEEEYVSNFSPEQSGDIDALRRCNGMLEITCDTDVMEFTHMIVTYFGTDDNGHAIEVSERVDFLRDEIYDKYMNPEPTPTPTPAPTPFRSTLAVTSKDGMARVVHEDDGETCYDVVFSYANIGDVSITPEYITTTWYENNTVLNVIGLGQEDLRRYLYLYDMTSDDQPVDWGFSIYDMRCTHVETLIHGVDENGRVHEAVLRVPCEKYEPTPAPAPFESTFTITQMDDMAYVCYDDDGSAYYEVGFAYANSGDVPITPEYITTTWYENDTVLVVAEISQEDIRVLQNVYTMTSHDQPVTWSFAYDDMRCTHVETLIHGVDENGRVHEAVLRVPCEQFEPTPAPELPAAQIAVSARKDIAYVEDRDWKGLGYDVPFVYTNNGDVPFILEYIQVIWYKGDKVMAEGEVEVNRTLKKGESYDYPFGTDELSWTSVKSIMKGTDANGNSLEAEHTVQCVKTFADGSDPFAPKTTPVQVKETPAPQATPLSGKMAAISVTADSEVAYVKNRGDKGLGYDVTFTYSNASDIPFIPESIEIIWYYGDQVGAQNFIYPQYILYQARQPYEMPCGTDELNFTSIRTILRGKDESGNYMEAECTVQLVRTFQDGTRP